MAQTVLDRIVSVKSFSLVVVVVQLEFGLGTGCCRRLEVSFFTFHAQDTKGLLFSLCRSSCEICSVIVEVPEAPAASALAPLPRRILTKISRMRPCLAIAWLED